jgi:hypothetical protein
VQKRSQTSILMNFDPAIDMPDRPSTVAGPLPESMGLSGCWDPTDYASAHASVCLFCHSKRCRRKSRKDAQRIATGARRFADL